MNSASRQTEESCPPSMFYSNKPNYCEFSCTDEGVALKCSTLPKPGCQCQFNTYYNKAKKECTDIDCKNLDCVGRANEKFFNCESGSREVCDCSPFVRLDCNTGCQCKNGFCRVNGKCVTRTCKGSPFEDAI